MNSVTEKQNFNLTYINLKKPQLSIETQFLAMRGWSSKVCYILYLLVGGDVVLGKGCGWGRQSPQVSWLLHLLVV